MKIIIMGSGVWGSALAGLLSENKKPYEMWQKGVAIPPQSTLIGAIPTQAIREVLSPYKNTKEITYVNSAKGLEQKTHYLPYQIVMEMFPDCDYFTLLGPGFSQEVTDKMPTLVNLGYRNKSHAADIQRLFQTDYFRVRLTHGIRSLELAAAFKNMYAIACGVADGLGFGMNTRVKLMCLAMEEFNMLRQKLEYRLDEQAIPGTIGDLVLTCSSEESRNYSFGKLLATYSAKEALEKIEGTVEGYHTAESVPYFERETGVHLPLARLVHTLSHTNTSEKVKDLFINFVKSA